MKRSFANEYFLEGLYLLVFRTVLNQSFTGGILFIRRKMAF